MFQSQLTKIGPSPTCRALLAPFMRGIVATSCTASMVVVIVIAASKVSRATASSVTIPLGETWRRIVRVSVESTTLSTLVKAFSVAPSASVWGWTTTHNITLTFEITNSLHNSLELLCLWSFVY